MVWLRSIAICTLCVLVVGGPALGDVVAGPVAVADDVLHIQRDDEPIIPIPLETGVDRDKAALGRQLFHDPLLSSDGSLSCASCHDLSRGGQDGLPLSFTKTGEPGVINTPTVFNSAVNFRLGWRGNFRTLEEQIEVAIHKPDVMNTTWADLLSKLRAETAYAEAFQHLYEEGLRKESVLDAIAVFERSLLTPNARFDQYLRGREDVLTEDEKDGYELFKGYGCVSCHQGINVGGNLFQKVGVFEDYFAGRGNLTQEDLGRMLDTGVESDRYVFRVPGLRNVALTGPYFHDGSVVRLEDAVQKMAQIQLGIRLTEEEVDLITKFLGTLTGEFDGRPLEVD